MLILHFLPSPWTLATTDLLSVSVDLLSLDISYKRNHKICHLLRLASFTEQNVFQVHPCCSTCQCSIPSYYWIIARCMETVHFVCPFISCGHADCFHSGAVMSNAAVNICTQVSGQTDVFGSLEYVVRSGTAGHMIKLCLLFWGNAKIFPKVAVLPIQFLIIYISYECFPGKKSSDVLILKTVLEALLWCHLKSCESSSGLLPFHFFPPRPLLLAENQNMPQGYFFSHTRWHIIV